MSDGSDVFDRGMKVRRKILGDAHVDRAEATRTPLNADFQDFLTRYAWGEIWSRPGLDLRIRSCITVAMLVALNHPDELALHLRAALRNGVTPAELREVLLQVNRSKTNAQRLRALAKIRPQQIVPEIPRNAEPRTGLSMGEHTAIMAADWGIGREEQDELAASSHRHLAAAYDTGFLDDLVTPFLGLERDQNLRPDSSPEKLAKLRPVFGGPDGTMTAGNSTPLSDGASSVLLAGEEWAAAHGIPVQAYFTEAQTAGVDYVNGGEGLLMAPAYAMPRMLDRAGAALQDFDFYEIHEAFAAQVLCTLKAWEDPVFCRERLGREQRAPADGMQRLRQTRAHAGAFAGGKHNRKACSFAHYRPRSRCCRNRGAP